MLPPPVTAKQRVVMIPGSQSEEEMDEKILRKGRFQNENGKRQEKGQQAVQDQSITMEKSWVMTKDRTD